MAGDWIKFRCSLLRDGRVRKVSRSCHVKTVTVVGGLVTLWALGDEQADEKGVLDGYTKEDLNDEIGIEKFCESLPDCWIDLTGEFVKLPNYQEHNGTTGKKRAQDQKRQKEHRNKSQEKCDKKATREEKRREENKESKKKKFTPPELDQVIEFFDNNGYTEEHAIKVFKYYQDNDWKDSFDKPVRAWKQKMRGNWFKEDGKKNEKEISPFKQAVEKAKKNNIEPFRGATGNPPETPEQFIERVNHAS